MNKFNWDDVVEKQYINSEGTYSFKVKGFKTGESTNTKTKFVEFECVTKDKEEMKVSFWLTDKAMFRYKLFVKACGLSTSGEVDLDELPKMLVGKKFNGVVEYKTVEKLNASTGVMEEKEYLEIVKFEPFAEIQPEIKGFKPIEDDDLPF